jgi:hypothetical protein
MDSTPLLSLSLSRSRDLLQARQRARQIARLLGFDDLESTTISALVLAIGIEGLSQNGGGRLRFTLKDGQLEISCQARLSDETEHSTLPFRGFQAGAAPLAQFFPGVQTEVDRDGGLRALTFALPDESPRLEASDLPWIVEELDRNTPLDPLEELGQWNQEFLQMLRLARAYRFFGEPAEQAA